MHPDDCILDARCDPLRATFAASGAPRDNVTNVPVASGNVKLLD